MASNQSLEPRMDIILHPERLNIYHPLAVNTIRVLTISPAFLPSDEISCWLEPVSLTGEDAGNYEALSYTRGSNTLFHTISVCNCPVKVTANVSTALRQLRDKRNPRTVWVDAICINQNDMAERSAQISLMSKIYSTASRVIIWLGTEVEGSDAGLRLLSERPLGLRDRELRAIIGALFKKQWWYRIWSIQEFLYTRERIFICGSITLSGDTMDLALCALQENSRFLRNESVHMGYFMMKYARKQSTLKQLMLEFGHCLATDPRDKVYAFLGLAEDADVVMLDYTLSVQNVYTNLVKAYMVKDRNLEIICAHHRGQSSIELPSWVPDWSICRGIAKNWAVNLYGESFFSAGYLPEFQLVRGREEFPSARDVALVAEDGLLVSGIIIGKISETAPKLDLSLFDENDWTGIRLWKPKDIESGLYLNGESNFRAFCRTIVADHNHLFRYTFFNGRPEVLSRLEEKIQIALSSNFTVLDTGISLPLRQTAHNSRFAKLSSGHFALVPNAAEVGDDVCILIGGSTLLALRKPLSRSSPVGDVPTENFLEECASGTYRMIGPCYVHGVMDGEMATQTSELFWIV